MAICRGCGEEIGWVKTPLGKRMPVNLPPVIYWAIPDGKSRIVTPNGEVVACTLEGCIENATGIGYVPHWATCTKGQDFKPKEYRQQEPMIQGSLFPGEGDYTTKKEAAAERNGQEKII